MGRTNANVLPEPVQASTARVRHSFNIQSGRDRPGMKGGGGGECAVL